MNKCHKLADLKALASSAVAEESSKAVSLLRTMPTAEEGTKLQVPTLPATEVQRPKEGIVTRVPSVLREKDMKAISAAKIYLMQGGHAGVSTNNVIQMALRCMKVGPELLVLLNEITREDGRRKP